MSNKKILAFGASNSKSSINRELARFTAGKVENVDIDLLDLNDFEMPIYSIDREKESGVHELAQQFLDHIKSADGIIISFAEHNGSYSAAYKNIYDWTSRLTKKVWMDKPMFLLATSPGGRGGKSVLGTAVNSFKFANSNTIAHFSLPSFHKNYSPESGIIDNDLATEYNEQLTLFTESL